MKIKSYGASDVGLDRLNNEDVWAFLPDQNLFLLADGMGGHQGGEVAASETVLELCRFVKEIPHPHESAETWAKNLAAGIDHANDHVRQMADEQLQLQGMGTTLCVALLLDRSIVIAHVGDSRIYRMRKRRLSCLTRDHSLRGEMIAKGQLEESDAASFPYKNVITRAIGTQQMVKPEIQILPLQERDSFFLCSDGLTDPLSDAEIQEIIEDSSTLQEASDNLILEAKKAGGSDNITIVMFSVSEID